MELQERQVRKRLEEDFGPHIDMSDCSAHSDSVQSTMRLSRALAALSLAANLKVEAKDACGWVVDESGDHGIDAVGVSPARGEVYLIQAKTSPGSPSPTEVMKFADGIRAVLDWNWDVLGPKLRRRRAAIENALLADVRVIAVFTHLGSREPNAEAKRLSDQLVKDVNLSGDVLEFRYEGLRENHGNRNIASGLAAPDYELFFERWMTIDDYRSELIGVVTGEQVAAMVESYGDVLFDKNIRAILKSTETNKLLAQTLQESPEEFWYYNNGITIVANSIRGVRTKPRTTGDTFSLKGLSIVNGAQTSGALAQALRDGVPLEDVRITVRAISTEGHDDSFGAQVTRYTNTQNQVTGREFVALDPRQQEWSDTLRSERIHYSFRSGQVSEAGAYNFTFDLEDATRALACFSGVENATRAKREIGRMWSDLKGAPYLDLFPNSLQAPTISNSVRFWRALNEQLKDIGSHRDSRARGIVVNSAYVCCTLLMQAAMQDGLDFASIDADPEDWVSKNRARVEQLSDLIIKVHEQQNSGGFPMSFFKNVNKVDGFSKEVRKLWSEQSDDSEG